MILQDPIYNTVGSFCWSVMYVFHHSNHFRTLQKGCGEVTLYLLSRKSLQSPQTHFRVLMGDSRQTEVYLLHPGTLQHCFSILITAVSCSGEGLRCVLMPFCVCACVCVCVCVCIIAHLIF